jgi:hypothetical protein
VKDDIESLDVEELPGIHGLRALRASIDLESLVLAEHVNQMIKP